MTDHDTRNRAQEHGVGRKVISELVAAFKKVPWHHADAYDGRDISATSDVLERTSVNENVNWCFQGTHDVTGHKRSQIASCADRVCGYIHARESVR